MRNLRVLTALPPAWTLLRHENNRSDAHPPLALSLFNQNCPCPVGDRRAERLCTDMERGALNGHG